MITYYSIIYISWAVFLLVWMISAFNVKRDIRGGYSSFWKSYGLIRLVVAVLLIFAAVKIATGPAHYRNTTSIFSYGFFIPPEFLGWLGAVLTLIGVLFAIWARFYLGRNWSPRPAVKEKHELVTGGPYAYVRHPIYSGMILAGLGATLAGTFYGIFILIFGTLVFLARVNKEEKIMLGLFPNDYPAYQARTKKLIPFVW